MRPGINDTMMAIAIVMSQRSTCRRRKVGAVITDANNCILATGYNGAPRGAHHCIDVPCDGIAFATGDGLDSCEAIHAEQNAITQCRDIRNAATLYTTTFPCDSCMKLLLATHIRTIVFLDDYKKGAGHHLWTLSQRELIKYEISPALRASLDMDGSEGITTLIATEIDRIRYRNKRPKPVRQGSGLSEGGRGIKRFFGRDGN